MLFEFATASRILFGPGVVKEVGSVAAKMGKRALVVTGRAAGRSLASSQDFGRKGCGLPVV